MPATDRWCNLHLSRADWTAFIVCLRRTGQPNCLKAAAAIETELGEQSSMSLDRELDKWESIMGPAFTRARKEEMGAFSRIIPQTSAARFMEVF